MQINSQFVPKYVDFVKGQRFSHLVMEFCEGVSLQEILDNKERYSFVLEHNWEIIRDLARAMKELESLSISHLDLKPDNILIVLEQNQYRGLKIIDFGFAVKSNATEKIALQCGTPNYMSP